MLDTYRIRCCTVSAVMMVGWICAHAEAGERDKPQHRHPIALAAVKDTLVVANHDSGTLTLIATDTQKVLTEHRVAKHLTQVVAVGENRLAVLEADPAQLTFFSLHGQTLKQLRQLPLPGVADRALFDERRKCLFVSCRWKRSVVRISCRLDQPQQVRIHKLSLRPHELLLLDENHLLVADAFSGKLETLDLETNRSWTKQLHGHNIRGLAVDRESATVLIAHQRIATRGRSDFDHIHWGDFIRNLVTTIPIRNVLQSKVALTDKARAEFVGRAGQGAAEPGPLLIDKQGRMALALQGVGLVDISRASYAQRLRVGAGPRAMLSVGDQLFVANFFDDTISALDLRFGKALTTIPLGKQPTPNATERGRRLFFNAGLSHDGWMSCNSCHIDGHTNESLVDTLGDGDYGAPKRVPSLFGVAHTGPWAWNGSQTSLAQQVRKSLQTTMLGKKVSDRNVTDLTAYLKTLPSRRDRAVAPNPRIATGRKLFSQLGCIKCHAPPTYTSPKVYRVQFADEKGRRKFNPPSLQRLGDRSRLLHDGRAKSISDVLRSGHRLDSALRDDEMRALVDFLKSL